jgi:hypothetical protein
MPLWKYATERLRCCGPRSTNSEHEDRLSSFSSTHCPLFLLIYFNRGTTSLSNWHTVLNVLTGPHEASESIEQY